MIYCKIRNTMWLRSICLFFCILMVGIFICAPWPSETYKFNGYGMKTRLLKDFKHKTRFLCKKPGYSPTVQLRRHLTKFVALFQVLPNTTHEISNRWWWKNSQILLIEVDPWVTTYWGQISLAVDMMQPCAPGVARDGGIFSSGLPEFAVSALQGVSCKQSAQEFGTLQQ